MSENPVDYYLHVEEAWLLSEAARDYVKNAGRPVEIAELWEKIFSASPLIDVARTQSEGGSPLERIFLTTPYGLQYRPREGDWIPFRHGPVQPNLGGMA